MNRNCTAADSATLVKESAADTHDCCIHLCMQRLVAVLQQELGRRPLHLQCVAAACSLSLHCLCCGHLFISCRPSVLHHPTTPLITDSLQDKPGAKALKTTTAPSVEFDNVCFSYQPNNPVLKNISFSIPGGKTLALVGATGSGKSSLLRLLFRFYDPTSGVIRVDGQAVGDVTQKSLRAAMAVVPQDTVLFNDTIMYNLR